MKITAIKFKDIGSCEIHIDNEAVTVDPLLLVSLSIETGDDISGEKYENIKREGRLFAARKSALRSLERTDFSKKGLLKRLVQKGIDEEDAAFTAGEMERRGLVSDSSFAKRLVEKYSILKRYGRRRTVSELMRQGVEKEEALEAVSEFAPEDEDNVHVFAKRAFKNPEELREKKERKRAYDKLCRAGYDYECARSAFCALLEEEDEF